jgi:hypothetical protein
MGWRVPVDRPVRWPDIIDVTRVAAGEDLGCRCQGAAELR